MYRIAILGCENTHANSFLRFLQEGKFPDVEAVGVYSDDRAAAEKLKDTFGVPVMESPDALVGKIDGLVITARDGKYHYPFAKPYMDSGIPMFIDKPITVSGEEAVAFMREAKAKNVRLSGGSSCRFLAGVKEAAEAVKAGTYGRVMGASVCCPIHMDSPYSGFYFYAQHLVEIMTTVFGGDVRSVITNFREDSASAIFRYDGFDVTASYSGEGWYYHLSLYGSKAPKSLDMPFTGEEFLEEFREFYDLLNGGKMEQTYDELIRPVFILNAMEKASKSGKFEEIIKIPVEGSEEAK